ncbi:MAG: hypothetical protein BWY04_00758 [candidate division CPR1 bacterium ADurb.Bin160]|uniref:Eukaryotic and archaeal DNA primase small subunit n=1 Tax=candidate division CPR1 bacterium ADurb.Bin160 TaxID=1852826 RepID=A0A1V5ZNC9_9BACT|nr:MAG: hypothetical protein BWY04_00758 [candidate division CPR1 bacterium ADurb.Bin160]
MTYPEHEKTIVLKNNFYPSGLKEIDIWNYYQENKSLILEETKNRNVMFFIFVDLNKSIILRKKENKYIQLNKNNFDKLITGRTVSIHSSMRSQENFGILDIDFHNFEKTKQCTEDVYQYAMNHIPIIKNIKIRYTGKDGFHLFLHFKKKYNIDSIRTLLLNQFLLKSHLKEKYTIGFRRTTETPNIDLSSNKNEGNFITLGSLSVFGLRCMEISFDQLKIFQKINAKIK